jgi:hypothetical protein
MPDVELKADIRLRVWHRIKSPIPNPHVAAITMIA